MKRMKTVPTKTTISNWKTNAKSALHIYGNDYRIGTSRTSPCTLTYGAKIQPIVPS